MIFGIGIIVFLLSCLIQICVKENGLLYKAAFVIGILGYFMVAYSIFTSLIGVLP